jgi:hypothetical protein
MASNILSTESIIYFNLLTNSTNKHSNPIYILKMSSDYNTLYSVDATGIMKIWNFNITYLEQRQIININGSVGFYHA